MNGALGGLFSGLAISDLHGLVGCRDGGCWLWRRGLFGRGGFARRRGPLLPRGAELRRQGRSDHLVVDVRVVVVPRGVTRGGRRWGWPRRLSRLGLGGLGERCRFSFAGGDGCPLPRQRWGLPLPRGRHRRRSSGSRGSGGHLPGRRGSARCRGLRPRCSGLGAARARGGRSGSSEPLRLSAPLRGLQRARGSGGVNGARRTAFKLLSRKRWRLGRSSEHWHALLHVVVARAAGVT
mmetsp:Transcript_61739/g.191187  ORF Transcript_61739/g.191187 Transcript_61739/m.191187 type:complete len:236 (+) Transcript_61739:1091-1798(+)